MVHRSVPPRPPVILLPLSRVDIYERQGEHEANDGTRRKLKALDHDRVHSTSAVLERGLSTAAMDFVLRSTG